jgi:hypothetical protein
LHLKFFKAENAVKEQTTYYHAGNIPTIAPVDRDQDEVSGREEASPGVVSAEVDDELEGGT